MIIKLTSETKKLLTVMRQVILSKKTPDRHEPFGNVATHTHESITNGIDLILDQNKYDGDVRIKLNTVREIFFEDIKSAYEHQKSIDNSNNPCGEIPLPGTFVTQKPTHSVPLTMGGTPGIHPTMSTFTVDYDSKVTTRNYTKKEIQSIPDFFERVKEISQNWKIKI